MSTNAEIHNIVTGNVTIVNNYGGSGYTHIESTASTIWTCNHNLGFIPNIQIEDSIGDLVYPDRIANGINQSIIYFAISMAGIAHLS